MNLPLEVGAVDEDYRLAFAEVIVPVLEQFSPELLIVSAGFDAHMRDPLAGMRLSTAAFGAMTADLRRVAERCCRGGVVLMTEGGYDLAALTESIQAAITALTVEEPARPEWPAAGSVAPTRGRTAVAAARRALGAYWKLYEAAEE